MNTEATFQIKSSNLKQTDQIASKIGARLKGGEVIELISDLGGGKTTFVKSLVIGANSLDHVTSPSFVIENIYKTPKFDIHHFDLYRLGDNPGIIAHELKDVLNSKNVTIIEWAKHATHIIPSDRLVIKIEQTGNESRNFIFKFSNKLNYLVEDLC